MALPQFAVLIVNYLFFRWIFRKDIPQGFDDPELPSPISVLTDLPYFYGGLLTLGLVFIGYFAGSLLDVPPYQIALAGCAALTMWAVCRKQADRSLLKDISWPLFPFIVGLFVLVRGVENIGFAPLAARALHSAGSGMFQQILASAFGAGIGSNVINNIPMSLLSISVLKAAHSLPAAQYGALLGCNIGPNLAITGSLATMLVISAARKRGENIGAWEFFKIGLLITPLLLFTASIILWLVMKL